MAAHQLLESCSIPFIVLGDIAYQMKNNEPLHGHKVVFGVRRRHAVESQTSLLPIMYPGLEILTDGWRMLYNHVPVYIKILEKEYPTVIDPDIVFYFVETFNIPNPFQLYWNGPHLDI